MLLAAPEARLARKRAADGPRRIGILGGTFDPPHVGHLWLATLAADAMPLDRVLFMPAAQPPHKRQKGLSRAADRLLMTRLAIATDECFDLTAIEMERCRAQAEAQFVFLHPAASLPDGFDALRANAAAALLASADPFGGA